MLGNALGARHFQKVGLTLVDLSRDMPSLIECPYSLGVMLHTKHVEKVFKVYL
jgi:hypothetical protein